jgi:hypothetical protein
MYVCNVFGDNIRKKLIDWTVFRRSYTFTTAKTDRRGQSAMDVTEYTYFYCRKQFIDPLNPENQKTASEDFKRVCKQSPGDVFWEGGTQWIWMNARRERFQDFTKATQGSVDETSRPNKNMTDTQKEKLQDFVQQGIHFSFDISERGGTEWRILLLGALGFGVPVCDFSVCLFVGVLPGGSRATRPRRPTLGDPPCVTHPGDPPQATHLGRPTLGDSPLVLIALWRV